MAKEQNLISKKKPIYPISNAFRSYLHKYGRDLKLSTQYTDLTRYVSKINLYDKFGKDTLWSTVFFNDVDTQEIHYGLKEIYAILKGDGDLSTLKHLSVDRIDLCEYGNTLPFRVRIINKINENWDYFYVKRADASRILGLELEHILSPNKMSYHVFKDTLIEEHIIGIPADQFLGHYVADRHFDEVRLAKEFVKFNERCFIRLLGDMHSSNFVIDITPDFEEVHYRMRAIDFDQQNFEGKYKVYLPQFFKQNLKFVELVSKNLTIESVEQYQKEERSLILSRIRNSRYQIKALLESIEIDEFSSKENIKHLKAQLEIYYKNTAFKKCTTMGQILKQSLKQLFKKKEK